ncbi:type II secretion system secretin GspD [Tateyamaria omphalii]|uniref:type II secretion system secretin GspD n=1 Tax=Tateyamaria omphalii TaxID=299262 RepID=UPI001C99D05A|nr:type II secretion system secretin GspD [Tateyamaria omphalii]MBY5934929.1 type II secretion system secretin GspD [Tateyamaria omphalii]
MEIAHRAIAAVTTLLLLGACMLTEPVTQSAKAPLLANTVEGTGARTNRGPWLPLFGRRNADRRVIGTDSFVSDAADTSQPLVSVEASGDIILNLVNVPIDQAAKAVLADALSKNYTIDPGVSGTVTLQTTRPLTQRAMLDTFQTVLELNGATLQTAGDLITIVPAEGATRRISSPSDISGAGSRIVALPLRYIGTEEMIRLLTPIAGSKVQLQAIPKRNVVLISGTRGEINAAIDAVNLFDVDVLKGKSVGLFTVKSATPEAIVEELNVIFETGEGGNLQDVVSFLPSQQLGAVIVVSTRSKYLGEAERWIRDLDHAAESAQRQPSVFPLQHRNAEELAPLLIEMMGQSASREETEAVSAAQIVADKGRNALLVMGTRSEQEAVARLIQTLDTTPVQVLLEATIAEVTLNDELNFGLRWFFEQGNFKSTFSDLENGAVNGSFPGLAILFEGSASSKVALSALSAVTDVEVVSSPSLLVLDNQEARLQIGDQVPIATREVRDTDDPNAPVVNSIALRDTGVILSVRPRTSNSGLVTLDIEQEVSSVSSTTSSGIDSPTISTRQLQTSVVVGDGETIAMGGLIQEDREVGQTKVPGAGDVPVLGTLFRSKSDRVRKTELLILITPRIVNNGHDARSVTNELRRRIRGAESLVQSGIRTPDVGHRIIE